ncbi:HlyD family secretion protein [Rhodoferax sp. WC2427]|uniref:HlyD family secretion protein n=1 Tax=Rhodoferax sp. WC2427 TaxID=3234144 RepID=UPI0034676958
MAPPPPPFHAWALAAGLAAALSGCNQPPPPGWSGYAEGDYVYVAAPVAGTLTTLSVQRGQAVDQNAPLFALDDQLAQAARAQAEAAVQVAQAQWRNGTQGRRSDEIAVIQAQLAQARALEQRTRTELQRQQQLVNQNFISRAHLDDAITAAAQARDRVAELAAALRVAQLPARQDEQAAARATTDAAQQALAQQLWHTQQAHQTAPAAALVADTYFRVGEYVPAGQPVLALLPPQGRKARFFVAESALGGLAIGQAVRIQCDGCGPPIAARISFIAPQAEYTPPVIYSNAQRARLVFMVEARPALADAARLHPGQPLDVFPAPGP